MWTWLAIALITAVTLAVLAWPSRGGEADRESGTPAGMADAGSLAVYRDQIAELEADTARGAIDAGEAQAARAEIARRMFAVADGRARQAGPVGDAVAPEAPLAAGRTTRASVSWPWAALTAPVVALLFYLGLGSPGLPGSPHADRPAVRQTADIRAMVAQVELRLRRAPEDGRGWEVIAPVYMRLDRHADAAEAYANAARLLGRTPMRLLGEAEARLLADDGLVTEVTKRLWQEAKELDPERVEPYFWLALGKQQEGDLAGAAADYEALLARPGGGEPWREMVTQHLARLRNAVQPAGRGPTAGEVTAAARMQPQERAAMISGMVDGLAKRLEAEAGDVDGWLRLIRSLVVLGRHREARAALERARRGLTGNAEGRARVDGLARELGWSASPVGAKPIDTGGEEKR